MIHSLETEVGSIFINPNTLDTVDALEAGALLHVSESTPPPMAMFERDERIFANSEVLSDDYRPDEIHERNDQISDYKRALQPIINKQPPSNIFCYGKTGTGKTATTKYLLEHLQRDAANYDDLILNVVWCSCENLSSSYQVAARLTNNLHDVLGRDPIPQSGHSQQWVFDRLYEALDDLGGTVILVLDEIDNIGHSDDILYGLPRAPANGYVETVRPVIIGISNDLKFRQNLSPKVKDTLAEKEILFPPYDASELNAILSPRADAGFLDGILEDDVVPLCSAFAAQDSGSARQALRLLREAGRIALSEQRDVVTESHVRQAQDELEKDQLIEGLRELTTQGHAVLSAVVYYEARGETPVRTKEVYRRYRQITDQIDMDTVSDRRVRDHISDLEMLGITRRYEENTGPHSGRSYTHELVVSLDDALDTLRDTNRFEDIANVIDSV